ncbi:GNAT family N-acetyltransferase [Halosimplex sp. J119]
MEVRDARTSDADGIAAVATESLRASYDSVLDDDAVENLVDEWYDDERIDADLEEESTFWQVAEDDDEVVGFVQGELVDTDPTAGEIHWLHVAPDARDEGVGRQLLGAAQETFEKRGADVLRGDVIAANEEGWSFYEADGFERVGETEVTIADETHEEYVYQRAIGDAADETVVEAIDSDEGELFVNFSEGDSGSEAPFYAVYRTRDLEEEYGWYCSNCESIATSMDSMGRIECSECGNRRKATRWDGSYL